MVRLVVSNSGPPPLPDIGRSFGGSDARLVHTSVRGDVLDLAVRVPVSPHSAVTATSALGTRETCRGTLDCPLGKTESDRGVVRLTRMDLSGPLSAGPEELPRFT